MPSFLGAEERLTLPHRCSRDETLGTWLESGSGSRSQRLWITRRRRLMKLSGTQCWPNLPRCVPRNRCEGNHVGKVAKAGFQSDAFLRMSNEVGCDSKWIFLLWKLRWRAGREESLTSTEAPLKRLLAEDFQLAHSLKRNLNAERWFSCWSPRRKRPQRNRLRRDAA
ncbi:unnamed protein product [Caenorhabditis auriculariae]|uniref:Uncharacterized protein n=1 Tax=Caenorhabditis auriculariae TaxID=2777116 RepID=A0A8S1HWD3_9PELO|nr:unnamed protein product [Caenorhabditis auriculariae]